MDENNEKLEPTYWETTSQSTPNAQPPLENTQFQNQENPFLQANTPQALAKKKKPKALIAIILILVIIGAGAAVAYSFKDRLMNTIALTTKSPKEYYVSLEKSFIDEQLESITSDHEFTTDIAQKNSLKLTYNKKLVDSLLSTTGITLSDIENQLGITLDSVGLNNTLIADKDNFYTQVSLLLNKKSLISAEIFLDFLTKELSILLPDLSNNILTYTVEVQDISDAYVYDNVSNVIDSKTLTKLMKNIKQEDIIDLIKRYSAVVLDNIDDVELEKGVEYSIDDKDITVNRLTVVIDGKTIQNIALETLKELKNDSYIQSFLAIIDVDKKDYQDGINEAITNLKNQGISSEDAEMTLELYVDQNGSILGRSFKVSAQDEVLATFGYGSITSGADTSYEYYMLDSSDKPMAKISGSHKKEDNAYTGEAKIALYSDMDLTVTVAYDDFKSTTRDGNVYLDGSIDISSLYFMGISLGAELSSNKNTQEIDFHVSMANENLFNINLTTEMLDKASIPSLPKDAVSYDLVTEVDQYAATIDIEGFLVGLSEKLGINVSNLISNFLY